MLLEQGRQCLSAADFAAAEPLLRQAIAQNLGLAAAYELLGKLLYRSSRSAEAANVYRAWLQALPTDPVAAHLVAATGHAATPPRAADEFITNVFGRAAHDFDVTLAKLGYRAPQLIFECAAEVLDRHAVALEILDLGCGTGLCGEWFRPIARRLVGVDLSVEMLTQARRRRCYDELVCEELSAYADRCADRFHLVTAADVFCYFGDLRTVSARLSQLLQPGGWFVFSVEVLDEPAAKDASADRALTAKGAMAGVMLREHGRYAHGAQYVDRVLRSCGFASTGMRRHTLRFECGAPVPGLIVAARIAESCA